MNLLCLSLDYSIHKERFGNKYVRIELSFRHTFHIRECVLGCKIVHVHSVFHQGGTLVNLFSVDCKNDTNICTIFCNIDLPNLVHCIFVACLYLSILQLQLMQRD